MKKLLLILTILACAHSLRSMEVETPTITSSLDDMEVKISKTPISLSQIYSYFLTILPPEIARYIFSLQPGNNEINDNFEQIDKRSMILLTGALENSYKKNGYYLTLERLKRNILKKNISICDIKNPYDETILHLTSQIMVAKILLEIAGNKTFALLSMQSDESKRTALHCTMLSGSHDREDIIRLYLDAAGNKAKELIMIPDENGKTAFDIAPRPEEKAIMLPYMQNNQ